MSATDEMNEVRQSAYQVGAWHADGPNHGPQCSANGEFCFLCAFRESGAADDVCSDMKAMIRIMVQQNKELPVIVEAVQSNYNANIRPEVTHKLPGGTIVESPEWTKTSIQTHLVFSTEFEGLFENVVTHIHQSVIMHLNAKMLKPSGHVDEETRKALIETVASLNKWKRKPHKS
jgi:hypothetical protein